MSDLRLVHGGGLTKKEATRLVKTFLAMTNTQLNEVLSDANRPSYERAIAAAVSRAVADGNSAQMESTIEALLRLSGRDSSMPRPPAPPTAPEPTAKPSQRLDADHLRRMLAQGTFIATKLTAEQAIYEETRIEKMRAVLDEVEAQLFDLPTIRSLPRDLQLRVYHLAAGNLGQSIQYVQGLPATFAQAATALSQVEHMERTAQKSSAPGDGDHLVSQVRLLIQEKIRERVEASRRDA